MKRYKTIFTCDECVKIIETETESGYPYQNGWRYLYNLTFKLENKRIEPERDKHFCSKKCLIKWVGAKLRNGN